MHGDLHVIKALRSEESITSYEALQFEPENCFNEECLFPLGPACHNCVTVGGAREELRQQLLEAKRASRLAEYFDERQDAMRPSNEKLKADELSKYFEFGSEYSLDTNVAPPPVAKLNSLLNLARSSVRPLESTQSVRALKSTSFEASSLRNPFHSDSGSSDVTIVHTSENDSIKPPTPTLPTTICPKFTTSQKPQPILKDGRSEVPRRPARKFSSSKLLHPPPTTPQVKVENWLSTLMEDISLSEKANGVSTFADIENRSKCGKKYLKRTTNSTVLGQIYNDYVSPRMRRRESYLSGCTPSSHCPLCSHHIGDPRDQHLLKCQYAHDEKGKLEKARKAAGAG